MCVESIVCNISVVFLGHSVYVLRVCMTVEIVGTIYVINMQKKNVKKCKKNVEKNFEKRL